MAEITKRVYLNERYPHAEQTILDKIDRAESDMELEQDRREWSDKMFVLGYISKAQNQSDRDNLEKATLQLDEEKQRLQVLQNETKEKRVKALEMDIEKAQADVLAKQSIWETEQAKERALRDQIERCQIWAPESGHVLHYPNIESNPDPDRPTSKVGASVREGQHLLAIADLISDMQANVKLPESLVDRVALGQRADVQVDAFRGQSFKGSVTMGQAAARSDLILPELEESLHHDHSARRPQPLQATAAWHDHRSPDFSLRCRRRDNPPAQRLTPAQG